MNLASENWLKILGSDLMLVLPECILIIGMCLIILLPFVKRTGPTLLTWSTAVTLLVALLANLLVMTDKGDQVYRAAFAGMLMIDPFSQFFKIILLLFSMFVVLQWLILDPRDSDPKDLPDFMCLLLGAVTGMALMASANNLLMLLIATETASLPSFALAGFRKRHRTGSESALKYVLFGAASSAIMIYGISLIYGATGTLSLNGVAMAAREGVSPLLAVGLAGLIAGIGFKLSAVPLHFWCPDVFEGAPVVVTTFLSVASKGAAVVMLARVLASFHGAGADVVGLAAGVGVLGAITATWGNLMAIQQNHLRRLLAFSSIAHAGYMMMGVSIVALRGQEFFNHALSAVLFYLLVYMFMNLGAFTVGAMVAARRGSEDIRDYAGMVHTSPLLAILMLIFLLSLFGMPGLGGFNGKIFLMVALSHVGVGGFAMIAVLLINTLISLYFYIRPAYYMFLTPDTKQRPAVVVGGAGMAILWVCAVMLLWTGVLPGYANRLASTFATIKIDDGVQPAPAAAVDFDGPRASLR